MSTTRTRDNDFVQRILIGALAVAFLLICVSCGTPNVLTSGKVIEKNYDDPDTIDHPGYWQPGTPESCSGGYGSVPRTCTPGTPGYYVPGWTEHDPAHWALRIQGPLRDGKEPLREWHQVPESEYNSYQVGDHWVKAE